MASRCGRLILFLGEARRAVTTEGFEIVRSMGLTHAEFLRSLPAAVAGMSCVQKGRDILIEDSGRRIRIRIGPEEQRRLGSLVLPQTQVELRFEGFSTAARVDFLRRFDRSFQRGGG